MLAIGTKDFPSDVNYRPIQKLPAPKKTEHKKPHATTFVPQSLRSLSMMSLIGIFKFRFDLNSLYTV